VTTGIEEGGAAASGGGGVWGGAHPPLAVGVDEILDRVDVLPHAVPPLGVGGGATGGPDGPSNRTYCT